MKRRKNLIYALVLLVFALGGRGLSIESPVSSNPLGLGTVPPSAYRSGLIPSINPVDTSGNLVVTGNVAGGKYFRGIVPYRGITDFGTTTTGLDRGTVQVENFMRRSTSSQDLGRTSGLTPYYSPTWSVTKIPAGSGARPSPQGGFGSSYSDAAGQTTTRPTLLRDQTAYNKTGYSPQLGRRPLSMSQQELEGIIDADRTQYPMGGIVATRPDDQGEFWKQMGVQTQPQTQTQLKPDDKGLLNRPKTQDPGLKTSAQTEPNIGMILSSGREGVLGYQTIKEPGYKGIGVSGNQDIRSGPDVFEQMKIKLGRPVPDLNTSVLPGSQNYAGQSALRQKDVNAPAEENKAASASTLGAAASVTDIYKSFAAYRDDKFNRYIMAAEDYMKQGKFYRAADSYTIAMAYKPADPLAYAGKSHALFAAGEYLSSSLFLGRALEIFPEYAKFKVDLVAMIGDKDTVETRILDAREWLEKSGSGELDFLLSYVYYQMDRMEFARLSIESATKKMPDSKAVAAMKQAIDERLANQN